MANAAESAFTFPFPFPFPFLEEKGVQVCMIEAWPPRMMMINGRRNGNYDHRWPKSPRGCVAVPPHPPLPLDLRMRKILNKQNIEKKYLLEKNY